MSWLDRLKVVVFGAALASVACSAPAGRGSSEQVGTSKAPLGYPQWPTESFVALNSIAVREGATLTGDVSVVRRATGAVLAQNVELHVARDARIVGNVKADSLNLARLGAIQGNAQYNDRAGQGTVSGTATTPLAVPLPIALPAQPTVSPGSTDVTVNANTTRVLAAGAYREIVLRNRAILRLTGGVYHLTTLSAQDSSRIECTSPCELRANGTFTLRRNTRLGPAAGATFGASDVQLLLSRAGSSPGDGTQPLTLQAGASVTAYVLALNGTARIQGDVTLAGKVVARDINVAADSDGTGFNLPVLSSEPQDVTVDVGQTASFSVVAEGRTLSYQWTRNGTNVAGATQATLTLANTQAADSGALFAVRVANAAGSVTSRNARLTVQSCAATDATCDGVDDDCSGQADEDYVGAPISCGIGACVAAGAQVCQQGVVVDVCQPGTPAANDASCNGVDDDCSGQTDEDFVGSATQCGVGACGASGVLSCVNGAPVDSCAPGIPAASDETCNGVDEDCNGQSDEDYVAQPISCGVGACVAQGTTSCSGGVVSNQCQPGNPAPTDTTCDAIDDDCSGSADEDFVGVDTQCGAGACQAAGRTSCSGGIVLDSCSPGTPASSDQTCDGIDGNCNGQVDEGYASYPTVCGVGACRRVGVSSCVEGIEDNGCTPGQPATGDASCDGIDDDCDGLVDEDFAPAAVSCGVGACAATGTTACESGAVVNHCQPGAAAPSDASCDGIDDDCNGTADEDFVDRATTCGVGACARTGQVTCAAGVEQSTCQAGTPAPSDISCDNVDDDCNGVADEDVPVEPIQCGVGVCAAAGVRHCVAGNLQNDCSPGQPTGADTTCDGLDDDCDGSVDEHFASAPSNCGIGACAAQGSTSCVSGQVLDSCRPGEADTVDLTCDGVDDDCNGTVDEEFEPRVIQCGEGACTATGLSRCESGVEITACTPGQGATTDATCNGVDDDCDGPIDEDYVPHATSCGLGACAATGQTSCVGGIESNSCVAGTAPAVSDTSCNGIDDDCDGPVDEDYAATSTQCGVGACSASGTTSCTGGVESNSCSPGTAAPSDATCNGVDDDCDGPVDEDYAPAPTSCGVGACGRIGERRCVAGSIQDTCQPGSAGPSDASCNGIDDDCNGTVDDGFVPVPIQCGVGACIADGVRHCTGGTQQEVCTPGSGSPSDSLCNGIDDDCNGTVDEDFVSEPTQCGFGACQATGQTSCVGGSVEDSCSAGGPVSNDAVCDGIDSDCDGDVDEAYQPLPTQCGVGACARTGMSSCTAGEESPGCVPGTAASSDATCNGIDDDCDGSTDEDYVGRATSCGVGACANVGTSRCEAGVEVSGCTELPTIGADTTCDGVDDDCNGVTDDAYEPVQVSCGVGACAATGSVLCIAGQTENQCQPGAATGTDDDCDGVDDDCDGPVDEAYAAPVTQCGVGACQATGELRCVGGATEDTCQDGAPALDDATCNGVDDDCDGSVDENYEPRGTSCGRGACTANGTTTCQAGREVDSCSPGTGAPSDQICNGIDDDCDGTTDEDYVVTPTTCGVGACQATGSKTCSSGSEHDSCQPAAAASDDATCNGVDDDCSGAVDEDYVAPPTSCGIGACAAEGHDRCVAGQIVDDCQPSSGSLTDATCNGIDDDCDGPVDEDYQESPTSCGTGACARTGTLRCSGGSTVNDCSAGSPAADDSSCNGVDDDCDGPVDEEYTATATSCGVGACAASGEMRCVAGSLSNSCQASSGAPSDQLCNGIDDDCDGSTDEDYVSAPTQCGVGACQASGATSCVSGVVQDSCRAGTAAASDATCDGIDNDCDGSTDEGYQPQATTCGVGGCARTGTTSCNGGIEQNSCSPGSPAPSDETCNGVDDDCNGSTDEDYQETPISCGLGACAAEGMRRCQEGVVIEQCTEGSPAADDSLCNGVDDDCNGSVDEDYQSQSTSCGVGACAATGSSRCEGGAVVPGCTPGTAAGDDASCDGVDNDCDGSTDEGYLPEPVQCGVGACVRSGQTQCAGGQVEPVCTAGTAAPDDASCNGIDDDCNGSVDEDYAPRATDCGVGACRATGTTACQSGQEVDSCRPTTGAPSDAVCNGLDDDCDGNTDEDYVPEATGCGIGVCAAVGTTECRSGAVVPLCTEGSPTGDDSLCNGLDDDCDGSIDEAYAPLPLECGMGACRASGTTVCSAGVVLDECTPGAPANDDALCNGVDDDCDGPVDEEYAPTPTTCGVGECLRGGSNECTGGQVTNTCQPGTAAPDDASCDGKDNDCSGAVDEDYALRTTSCGVGACAAQGTTSCSAGIEVDSCTPRAAALDDASCNGVDDDCDGPVDEEYAPETTSCGQGACAAQGSTSCSGGQIGNSCQPGNPASSDATCDGIDNDCDGPVDEEYQPQTTVCGIGACRTSGAIACQNGQTSDTCTPLSPSGPDTNCDGVDDDCDGSADEGFVVRCAGTAIESCAGGGLSTQECVDQDSCNGTESCAAAQCVAGTPVDTNDGNACTADSCGPGGVLHTPLALGTGCGAGRVCDGQGECIGKPVITTQPSSVTVSPGGSAGFGVTATGALLSYQWRRIGQPIAGATAATFSLSGVQPADSGAEITVAVSNPAGTVVSSPAILTVSDDAGPLLTVDGEARRAVTTDIVVLTGTALDNGQAAAALVATSDRFPGEVGGLINVSGAFRIEVPVSPGANSLTIIARDAAGNATQHSIIVDVEVPRLPRVTITEPTNGLETDAEQLDVRGSIRSALPPEQIRVVLGSTITFPTGENGEYTFEFEDVRLNLGANLISVRAETPDGAVTTHAAVLRRDPGEVSANAPVISVIGGASLQFVKEAELPIKGTVSAQRCTTAVTVNGAAAPLGGSGSEMSFTYLLPLPAGDTTLPVLIQATDCDGRIGRLEYTVHHDDVPPVIEVDMAPSVVHNVASTPFLVVGRITEANLASVTTNQQSMGVLPGTPGTYDFSFPVPLTRGQDTEVRIEALDHAGNPASYVFSLHLDAVVDIEVISPTAGAELLTLKDPFDTEVVARIVGLPADYTATVQLDGAGIHPLNRADATFRATIPLRGTTAAHTFTFRVRNGSAVTVAEKAVPFKVTDANTLPINVTMSAPLNGASNIEANEAVVIELNRPVADPRKIKIELTETVHGHRYKPYEQGSTFTEFTDVQLEEVHRDQQAVPGGMSYLPGDRLYAFYPARDYGYGGQVNVRVLNDTTEIFRGQFGVRPLPTLISGFVTDQFYNPIDGLELRLDNVGVTTSSNVEGVFSFGFGRFEQSIPSGRHLLVINPGLKNRRYGTVHLWVPTQPGRLHDMRVVPVPLLDPGEPFRRIRSNQASVLLRGGDLELDLSQAALSFPDGASEGDVHTGFFVGPAVGYPSLPIATPFLTYGIQPMGIEVSGPFSVDFALPAVADSNYLDALPEYAMLIGLDPDALMLVPIGVGRVDHEQRRLRSTRPLEARRLDFIAMAPFVHPNAQSMLASFANGEIDLRTMIRAVEVAR